MYIQEAQYADDIAPFSNNAKDLQCLLTSYNGVLKRMGLCINVYIDDVKLTRGDCLQYVSGYVLQGLHDE